jgi:hypothetical protein
MGDLRDRMERLAERARPEQDAFERLERRRRRKERNRRIGAGVLALVLVAGVSLAAWTVLSRDDRSLVGGGQETGVEAASEVAEFACDGTGTISPSTSVVSAQADGVHIAITATGDVPVSLGIEGVGGTGAEPGEREETVWSIAPSETTVSCGLMGGSGSDILSSAELVVVDPKGLHVPAELDCTSDEGYGMAPSYGEGSTGVPGDPVQVVKDHVTGLEFDDRVERAGYPESEEPLVRIVRAGAVTGLVTLFDDGQDGWLLSSIEGCGGTQFGWSEEPAGVSGPPGPAGDLEALCAEAYLEGSPYRGTELHVVGEALAFDTPCLVTPGGEPFTITFSNLDEAVPRTISIYAMEPCLREGLLEGASSDAACSPEVVLYQGEIVTGVSDIVYHVPRLEPGEYYFQDDVHPGAFGVLIVE